MSEHDELTDTPSMALPPLDSAPTPPTGGRRPMLPPLKIVVPPSLRVPLVPAASPDELLPAQPGAQREASDTEGAVAPLQEETEQAEPAQEASGESAQALEPHSGWAEPAPAPAAALWAQAVTMEPGEGEHGDPEHAEHAEHAEAEHPQEEREAEALEAPIAPLIAPADPAHASWDEEFGEPAPAMASEVSSPAAWEEAALPSERSWASQEPAAIAPAGLAHEASDPGLTGVEGAAVPPMTPELAQLQGIAPVPVKKGHTGITLLVLLLVLLAAAGYVLYDQGVLFGSSSSAPHQLGHLFSARLSLFSR